MNNLIGLSIGLLATAAIVSGGTVVRANDVAPGFRQILPQDIKWTQSGNLQPGGKAAVMVGNPAKPEPYIVRVAFPDDFKVDPHTHADARVYTVISGTFYIGFGEKFDPAQLKTVPQGSIFELPADAPHFHWMKSGPAVVQISGIGPSKIDYIDPTNDPRKK